MKANKTIRWKVVDKNRESWVSEAVEMNEKYSKLAIKWFTKLKYEKNKITKAPKKSLGCFCFKTKTQAQNAILIYTGNKLLKVKAYGRGKNPGGHIAKTYPGTICYPAVMPLE